MKRLTILVTDIVVFYGALALVLLARYGVDVWHTQYRLHLVPFSILLGVWALSFYIANLYDERTLRNDREFFSRLTQAIVVAGVLSVLFFYLIPLFGIAPRANLFFFIIVFTALEAGARTLINRLLASGTKKRLLIIGLNTESLELAQFIDRHPQLGWAVHAIVRLGRDELPLDDATPWHVLDERTDIATLIRHMHIASVAISPQAYGRADLIATLYSSLNAQVDFFSLATFTEQITGTVPLGAISQQWFLENIAEGSKRTYEIGKRAFDVVASVVIGIPTLILLPFIALAVKVSSPGPLLFIHTRTGRGGKPFAMVKFRSMRTDAEQRTGPVWATENDPRVTAVGRFLRKTRIDELPQLWNILKGDMSLVGPRAERPEMEARLSVEIPFYGERYLIKPGLSGWAQINYPYGASPQDAMRKLEYDLYYLKHRSLALDLEIVLKTLSTSLRRAGR